MSKSLIYLTNTTSNTVSAGSAVPLGSITRKYGNGYTAGSNSVYIAVPGYYQVDFNGTYTGTAGNVKVNVNQNGTALASATGTVGTASTEYHNAEINTVARVYCCAGATITVTVDSTSTSTPTFSSTGLRVIKV